MSDGREDVSSQPLVIVRRRRNAEEAHHGGVWKIAYADFMTAMMAFFLVMWLVNAADKKTIVQVAAYFNPMHLTDRYAAPKGIEDLSETPSKRSEEKGKRGFEKQPIDEASQRQSERDSKESSGDAKDEASHEASAGSGGKSAEEMREMALFDDPGTLLEKLADEAKASQSATAASPSDGNIDDPFDRINRRAGRSEVRLKPAPQAAPVAPEHPSNVARALPAENVKPVTQDSKQQLSARASMDDVGDKPKQQDTVTKQTPATLDQAKKEDKTHDKDHDKDQDAKDLQERISKAVADVSHALPMIDVKSTPEGLLISLTDDANFGMFEVGSAKPRSELVLVMEKIGRVLSTRKGNIVLRGHTDSRPYKSGIYDNWRLSAARAQMAYYMLLRGGVDESRVVAIEGRADRDPKVPEDTLAATNRRIDILLREDKR